MGIVEILVGAAGAIAGIIIGIFIGWYIGRAKFGNDAAEVRENMTRELDKNKAGFMALKARVNKSEDDARRYSVITDMLPGLASELSADLRPRKVTEVLLRAVDRVLSAGEIYIFLLPEGKEELILSERKVSGKTDGPASGARIAVGEGHVGWVAQKRVTMEKADFSRETALARSKIKDDPLSMVPDICAPMVYRKDIIGAIAVRRLPDTVVNGKKLLSAVAHLGAITLVNARLFQKTEDMANQDGLTGLSNKRHFLERLNNELARCDEMDSKMSLFIFDIDHFKSYNDNNGHVAGDEALKQMARVIKENLRGSDLACRYGGEEFVILFRDLPGRKALDLADRLREVVAETEFPFQENQPLGNLTVSGGVASYPDEGRLGQALLEMADRGLYYSKEAGRNRVTYLENDIGPEVLPG